MTLREQAAFRAGLRTAVDMALTAAVSIETREDADGMRQRAAAAALQGFADGVRATFLEPPAADAEPVLRALAQIADDPGDAGVIECPACQGRLTWVRDRLNGHLHGECETAGCLRWMQ